jgi:hypothetical protein
MRARDFTQGVTNFVRNLGRDADAPIVMMTNPRNRGARAASNQRISIEDFPLKTVAVAELQPWEPMIKIQDLPSQRTVVNLIQTLRQGGQIPPLLVTPVRGGYRIIDGHHRYAALQRAGIDHVAVRVVDPRLIRYSDEVMEALRTTVLRYGKRSIREDRTATVELDGGERRQVRYVPGRGDWIDWIIAYYWRQGRRVLKVDDHDIDWDDDSEVITQTVAESKITESALFLNPNTVIVGQEHAKPLSLSPETLKKVQAIAAKHGAWYEGNGSDRVYTRGVIDRYVGSWDDEVAQTASVNDPKWLYVLFANVDANNRVQRVGINPKSTIFDQLLSTAKDNSYQGIGFTSQALQKFLSLASEGQYDFVKMSQLPATEENLTKFLKAGESLMWPSNWEQYPNRAGKIAKAATVDARDQYLATRKAGVYVVGSGHLKAVQNITGKQGVAEGRISDIDIDLQDQQWEAMVGFVQDGVRRGRDADRMSVDLYRWAGGEQFDMDEELERRGFASVTDLADHIREHGGRYVPPQFDLSGAASLQDIERLGRRRDDGVQENFADGKNPGRRGLSRRVGIPRKATLGQLEKIARSSTGERRRMAQWQLNMRRGKARKNK